MASIFLEMYTRGKIKPGRDAAESADNLMQLIDVGTKIAGQGNSKEDWDDMMIVIDDMFEIGGILQDQLGQRRENIEESDDNRDDFYNRLGQGGTKLSPEAFDFKFKNKKNEMFESVFPIFKR